MGAPVVWFEVAGRDLQALTRFYGELFGWKVDTANPMRYGMVDTGADGGIPGGIFAPGEDVEYVSVYVSVPDLAASLTHAETLGAKVAQPPTPIDGGATIAMVTDPEGHRIGLIQQPA
jgi:predicted enzyme related to lactoylglutathione lyase